jgi:hypothetical protein
MSAYHKNRSEEHKQRISKALKGRKHSQQTIEQMKARIITNDTKQKLSDSLKGKKKSQQHCQAIKDAQSGEKCPRAKKWLITYPDGLSEIVTSLKTFCEANGYNYQQLKRGSNKAPIKATQLPDV